MGKAYSLNGYLNAVLRRSARTLLVEGPTDKLAIHRVLAEQPDLSQGYAVDHAALIDDKELASLGAKAKILIVRKTADTLAEKHPSLSSMLGCLVDREWDGLSLDAGELNSGWTAPIQLHNHFVTLGHSIENYHFDKDCILRYLKFAFAEHFTNSVQVKVTDNFRSAIALAGAVSFEVQANSCITRLGGLVLPEHIESRNAGLYLASSFVDAACTRQIADPDLLLKRVNDSVDSQWRMLAAAPHAHWLLHGHIGSDVLWACIGYLTLQTGVPFEIAEQIARGGQHERRRCWLDWLATGAAERRIPLDHAVAWLQA